MPYRCLFKMGSSGHSGREQLFVHVILKAIDSSLQIIKVCSFHVGRAVHWHFVALMGNYSPATDGGHVF